MQLAVLAASRDRVLCSITPHRNLSVSHKSVLGLIFKMINCYKYVVNSRAAQQACEGMGRNARRNREQRKHISAAGCAAVPGQDVALLSVVGQTFMTALPRTLVANCTCCFHWLT